MKIQEAYQVLKVSETITDADLKKIYRDIAKAKHPDKGGDANEFKVVNEAYQLITDYRVNPQKYQQPANPFVDIQDFFQNISVQGARRRSDREVLIDLTISFEESILGVSREIEYEHRVKCGDCNGVGGKKLKNSCLSCDGFGRIISQNAGFLTHQTCQKCYGRGHRVRSSKCDNIRRHAKRDGLLVRATDHSGPF